MRFSLGSWSRKQIRIVVGIVMMTGFLDMARTIYFFMLVGSRLSSWSDVFLMVFGMSYLWVPCLVLIVFCYLLLTRVWRYEQK